MFVPLYQGLSAVDFVRPVSRESCYPFTAPGALGFYRARNAIYHLFAALGSRVPRLTVLVPDYNSGNEVMALAAAGAAIRYYPIGPDMLADPGDVERLCERDAPDVLYVIHYLGWPQPIAELAALCRRRGMLLVEDCALSLLSQPSGRPLGSTGHWSVYCLYKTLPVPNGSLLVQNAERIESLDRLRLRGAGAASVAGRLSELLVQRVRGRAEFFGRALQALKRTAGRAAGAIDISRSPVGDIGFNPDDVDLAMSGASSRLLRRLDFAGIRRRRVDNFRTLSAELDGHVTPAHAGLSDGVCPLFYPILVADKAAAARALGQRGVDVLEFWNHGAPAAAAAESGAARFLRAHVLALPVHQDLTRRQLAFAARAVRSLRLRIP
jgi:dTDP-4-amino-4,6-dideoxygalactose transaminase